jgi:tight adherence protein C
MSALPLVSSALTAVAVLWLARIWFSLSRPEKGGPAGQTFEAERRQRLRAGNAVYRRCGPLVDELAGIVRQIYSPKFLQELDHALDASGVAALWRASEFLATKWLEGIGAGLVVAAILALALPKAVAVVAGIAVAGGYQWSMVSAVQAQAARRMRRIKARLPFAVDLMALILQAGGTPADAFETVVRENRGHPLGEEFGEVVRRTRLGRPRAESLLAFRDRFPDLDIKDFVFAVTKGEELGTPMAQVLRVQADQMRLKHSQWCEKEAAEAGVKITFPSMLVMLGCVVVILGPLLLPVVFKTSQ